MSEIDDVRAKQAELYGAPLNVVFQHCSAALSLNQGKMAQLLGVSAPMLSQLINGHRIKLANPAAGARLAALIQAADAATSGELTVEEAVGRVGDVDPAEGFTTTALRRQRHLATEIQDIFRATASAADYLGAADAIRGEFPEVAELLTVYGAERADKAMAWTDRALSR